MYVDTHAHLISEFFTEEEIDDIMKRCNEIKYIINNGLDKKSNREVLELNRRYPTLRPALGFYPINALECNNIDEEIEFIGENKDNILAIGEVGLDYKYSQEKEKQKEILIKFIRLSEKINKPLIIHSRKAELDAIELLEKSSNKKIIFHSFTGKLKLAKRIEDNGWFLSIPTALYYSEQFQRIVKETDISRILTETDSPFMNPLRKEKNDPSYIPYSIEKIAEIKAMDKIEVKNNIFMNFQKVF